MNIFQWISHRRRFVNSAALRTLRCGLVSLASATVHTTSKEKAITIYKILALRDHLNSRMVVSLEVHAMAPMTWNWMLIIQRLFILAVLILAIATSTAAQTVWSMVSILCEVSYVTSMLQLYTMWLCSVSFLKFCVISTLMLETSFENSFLWWWCYCMFITYWNQSELHIIIQIMLNFIFM